MIHTCPRNGAGLLPYKVGELNVKIALLFFMSVVIMIDLYLAERSKSKRPEVFYLIAALMLFGALLAAGGAG
jgi:hypothetical protein